jgi:hypothetical protein
LGLGCELSALLVYELGGVMGLFGGVQVSFGVLLSVRVASVGGGVLVDLELVWLVLGHLLLIVLLVLQPDRPIQEAIPLLLLVVGGVPTRSTVLLISVSHSSPILLGIPSLYQIRM